MIRVALDLNIFFADMLSRRRGVKPSAASTLVNWVKEGETPAGPIQLIISHPMLENYVNVLKREFDYSEFDAQARAEILAQIAEDGPIPVPPFITVGMGQIPFATEEEMRKSIENFLSSGQESGKLFDEIRDDRYVLETAIAGRADVLATTNISDFIRGGAVEYERDDMIVYPFAVKELVIARPSFVARWMSQGIIPDANFIRNRPAEFVRKQPSASRKFVFR